MKYKGGYTDRSDDCISLAMSSFAGKGDLTTGSVRSHLIRLTIPMIWGLFALISFQLVNTYYVSRLGTEALAAISYTFPVTYAMFSVFLGFGIAMSSVISRLIGEKKTEDVKRVTSHGILLVLLVSMGVAALGLALLDPIFRHMGAPEALMPHIRDYMTLYFMGTFIVSMPVVGNAALRATGDTVIPALIMTIAALTNAFLDPILIFGLFGAPRLEIQGAAISTIFSNTFAMLAGLWFMNRKALFDFAHIRNLLHFGDSARRLLVIAIPAGLTSTLPSLLNSNINAVLSKSGPETVAAFGVASRVEAFAFIIMMAVSVGMAPIIGQNWGARNFARVREALRDALGFCVLWSLGVALVLGAFADSLSHVFTKDILVQPILALYFVVVPISYGLSNVTNCWGSAYNAMGKPQYSTLLLLVKMVVLTIPSIYLGYAVAGPVGVFAAICGCNLLTGLGFHLMNKRILSRFELGLKIGLFPAKFRSEPPQEQ